MPRKHAVSFKHLIATSSRDQDLLYDLHHRTYPNISTPSVPVQELLDRSRLARPVRPVRPVLVDDQQGGSHGVGWIPRPAGRVDLELEEGPTELHPAEQLRRAQVAQRQAQRSVAGPAPPPSWRASRPSTQSALTAPRPALPNVTETDLHSSSRLFSGSSCGRLPQPRAVGSRRLLEYCFDAVIRYLESDEVVWSPDQNDLNDNERGKKRDRRVVTLGRAMREGLPYIEPHLKIGLLAYSSALPTDRKRLSDRSVRSLFLPPPLDISFDGEDTGWDDPSSPSLDRTAMIHHISITVHPSPHVLIRNITQLSLSALTSLNLAYSVIPKETEKLVNALPVGLRELGLVGVQCQANEKEWMRFLTMLGRKLIVLKMLDISLPPHPIGETVLKSLLHPPDRQIPSLRLLGLRGVDTRDPSSMVSTATEKTVTSTQTTSSSVRRQVLGYRRELAGFIRKDRSTFIDIAWE